MALQPPGGWRSAACALVEDASWSIVATPILGWAKEVGRVVSGTWAPRLDVAIVRGGWRVASKTETLK